MEYNRNYSSRVMGDELFSSTEIISPFPLGVGLSTRILVSTVFSGRGSPETSIGHTKQVIRSHARCWKYISVKLWSIDSIITKRNEIGMVEKDHM